MIMVNVPQRMEVFLLLCLLANGTTSAELLVVPNWAFVNSTLGTVNGNDFISRLLFSA
jgi:hypothetical protein